MTKRQKLCFVNTKYWEQLCYLTANPIGCEINCLDCQQKLSDAQSYRGHIRKFHSQQILDEMKKLEIEKNSAIIEDFEQM